jgi:hypothetical protein
MVYQLAGLIGAQPAEIVVHRRRILSWQPSHSWRRTLSLSLSPVALGTAVQLATAGLDAGGAGRTRILRDLLHHQLDALLSEGSSSTGIATGGCRTP